MIRHKRFYFYRKYFEPQNITMSDASCASIQIFNNERAKKVNTNFKVLFGNQSRKFHQINGSSSSMVNNRKPIIKIQYCAFNFCYPTSNHIWKDYFLCFSPFEDHTLINCIFRKHWSSEEELERKQFLCNSAGLQ